MGFEPTSPGSQPGALPLSYDHQRDYLPLPVLRGVLQPPLPASALRPFPDPSLFGFAFVISSYF